MDTLEVSPGKALGIFRLGDTLWHVLDLVRSLKTELPKVELSWDPDNTHRSAVTVHAGPIVLLFPPSQDQRLALIHVPVLNKSTLTLTYEGEVLVSPSHALTRAGVARSLGPTYASVGSSRLVYPGIAFELSPTGGREDLVAALSVTPRVEGDLARIEPLSECIILPGRGATLHLPDPVEIVLGETTAQDLLVDLGPPLRKFWKEDDRIDRVWGHPRGLRDEVDGEGTSSMESACFWNYFQLGLDFLILDGVVTKIIAHSNIPGTPQFQQYARCPWTLPVDAGALDFTSPLSAFRANIPSTDAPHVNGKMRRGSSPGQASSQDYGINQSSGDGGGVGDAMVLDRTVEGGLEGVVGMGTSELFGFDGLIVEIDQKSGGVTSIQVWKESAL